MLPAMRSLTRGLTIATVGILLAVGAYTEAHRAPDQP
jgi:hypothetical protein